MSEEPPVLAVAASDKRAKAPRKLAKSNATQGTKGPGGPTTAAGKAVSSQNAVTHGIFKRWFDPDEQACYDEWVEQLQREFGDSPSTRIMIDRVANAFVKLSRADHAESADFEKSRLLRAWIERQPHAGSIASTMIDNDQESHELAVRIATAMATPAIDRLESLSRYQTMLDRQLHKWLAALHAIKQQSLQDAPAVTRKHAPLELVHDGGPAGNAKARK